MAMSQKKKAENILKKKDVESTRSGKYGVTSVKHKNGSTYTTKQSSKGAYITVNGIRKYIVAGETY